MKQLKIYIIICLLIILIVPSVAFASWWNPFSWNIWQTVWNLFYRQIPIEKVSVECTVAKDCRDIYKNCYYSCSLNKCVQINTLVALKPYPDCSSIVSCAPNWQCAWGPCVNGAQSMTAVDSNKCGSLSVGQIACPALARLCATQGASCSGPDDASCPVGYKCIQSCGPPVAREGDLPPPYFCELNEIANKPRNCPICLASNTNISTPSGDINVKDIKVGMTVWSLNKEGEKVLSAVVKISSTDVPKTHKVVHLVLSDKRGVWASANHPTINGVVIGKLNVGDSYGGSKVQSAEIIPYWDNKTYDILPDSETGYYWANGILLGSTLGP